MKAFLGILLTMTIVKLPNFEMFWNKDSRLFNAPGVRDLFNQQRFRDIYICLCFRNFTKDSATDRMCKIDHVIRSIISHSQVAYTPIQTFSLDESMIAFKGRSKDKIYMPLKPIKFGLKAYVLCESNTGFVVNWSLHNSSNQDSKVDNRKTYHILSLAAKFRFFLPEI